MVELLIASVVVAMAGAMLAGALIASNRSAELCRQRILLTQLAANQLALLDDPLTDQTPTQGTFAPPLDAMAWTLSWTEASLEPLAQVTLSVTRGSHHTDVVTYRRLAQP